MGKYKTNACLACKHFFENKGMYCFVIDDNCPRPILHGVYTTATINDNECSVSKELEDIEGTAEHAEKEAVEVADFLNSIFEEKKDKYKKQFIERACGILLDMMIEGLDFDITSSDEVIEEFKARLSK